MAYPSVQRFNTSVHHCHSASIGSSPIAAMLRVPFRCQLLLVSGTAIASISAADCSVSVVQYVSGAATAIVTLTLPVSSADAGQTNTATPSAITILQPDDVIKFIPSGATGTNVPGTFGAVLKAY